MKALSSHQCGPCSNPSVGAMCELRLLLILYFAPRGVFLLRALRFSIPSPKVNISKFQFDKEWQTKNHIEDVLPTKLFIYLLLFFSQSTCEMDSSICGDNEVCIPNYQDNSVRCVCKVGYTGTPCSKLHKIYGYVINCP